MKATSKGASRLYLLNSALLATHEIDSAYWHEWELFHVPGGIQFFLIINFALLWIVIELRNAGVISCERQARSLIYRPQCSHMAALISYLSAEYCEGVN